MSTPVSAMASWAERRLQPGIDSAWASCSSYGVLPGAEDADEGGIDGADVGDVLKPRGRVAAGLSVVVLPVVVGVVPVVRCR
jgi:hypothetical protein